MPKQRRNSHPATGFRLLAAGEKQKFATTLALRTESVVHVNLNSNPMVANKKRIVKHILTVIDPRHTPKERGNG
ncbi:MAG TPA: hypothetical protein VKD65_13425, partial [Candidatus Angelobacter sp.]|nr:hypothetical protein [Candidatus Angelobacter sp.]